MKKSLICVAVLSAFSVGAYADPSFVINDDTEIPDVVKIWPGRDNVGSDKEGFLQNNAASAYVNEVREIIEEGGGWPLSTAYVKNFGGTLRIGTLTTAPGMELPSGYVDFPYYPHIVTFEFYPKAGSGEGAADAQNKSFVIDNANLSPGSVLRLMETSYNDLDKYMTGSTSLEIGTLTMSDYTALALGIGTRDGDSDTNLESADSISIDHLVVEDGATFAGIVAGKTNETFANDVVQIGTIDVNGNLLELSGEEKIEGYNYSYGGVTIVGQENNDGLVKINMNSERSQIKFGNIGVAAEASGGEGGEGQNGATSVEINFTSESLASENSTVTFGEDSQVAEGTSISAVALNGGAAGDTTQDVANKLLDKVYANNTVLNSVESKTVTVNPYGVEDGASYEVVTDEQGAAALGNVTARTENPITHGLTQMAVVGLLQWREEMNHMQYRLGEIRDQGGYNNGGWARVYGGKDEYGSQNVDNKYVGVQVGYDHRIEGTNWIVGGAFSYAHGDSSFSAGEGDNNSFTFTGYGTWLGDNGLFVDITGKWGHLTNDISVATGDASYETNAVAVTVEGGWRLPVTEVFYVEPQVEVMYGHVSGADYSLGGMDVNQDSADMMVGRVGFQTGLVCPSKKGGVYLRASALHDFDGETSYTYTMGTSKTHTEDLGGTWYEIGLGANYNITDAVYLYADVQYADGDEIESPWRGSLGVRFAW